MTQTQVFHRKLIVTSSLNEYFLCENCGLEKQFEDKKSLQKHIVKCCDKKLKDVLIPSKIQVTHKRRKSGTDTEMPHFCQVCQKKYLYVATLRYHIRKAHFNLISKTPYHQLKKVNQVWFENVKNSDAVIEVRKTGVNRLVLRRLGKNTAIKVNDVVTSTVDLSNTYPTFNRKKRVKCDECFSEVHPHLLVKHKSKHEREKPKLI